MKKNYKSSLSFLRKTGKRFIIAAVLVLGTGIVYGQSLMDEDFAGQVLPVGWDTANVIGNWSFDNPGGRSINGGDPGFDSDFAIFDSDDICSSSEEGTLESAPFNAGSATVAYILEFDNSFRSYVGATQEGHVEVWNGTSWTEVFTLPGGASDGYSTANHKSVDITAACGGASAAKVRFRSVNGACNWWWAIDNVTVMTISCPVPSGLAATNITSGSADIGWTATLPAPANGYEYYYSTSSTAPTTTTSASGSVGAGILTASLSGLSAITQYYVWVRSVCSPTDTSDWSPAAYFITLCDNYGVPFSENLDGGALPSCWTNDNGGASITANAFWKFSGAPGYGATANGRPTGTYAWVDASTPYVSQVAFTSPQIDLAGLTTPYIQFDWFKNNTDPGSTATNNVLMVDVNDGNGWVTVFTDTSNSTAWRTEGIALSPGYQNDTIQVRFVVDKTGSDNYYDDLLLDNIMVREEPTCFAPGGTTIANVTSSGADLSWTAATPNPGNGYQYYYNQTGTVPTNDTPATGLVGPGITTAILSGLEGNEDYYVWVRSVCSATDASDWGDSVAFKTLCGVILAPGTEDVESLSTTTDGSIGDCWSTVPSGTTSDYRWNVDGNGSTPTSGTGPSGAFSGTHYFYTEGSSGASGDTAVLISPFVDISALATPALVFRHFMYGANIGKLYIEISNGSTWATVDSIIGQQQSSDTDPWIKKTIVLTGYAGVIQVRFRSERGTGTLGDMALDDIGLLEAPSCFEPGNISLSAVTDQTATLSWIAASPAPANGYEYYYDTSNILPASSTVPSGSVGVGITAAGLTGLSELTTYYVWVRSICGANDKSDWVGPASLTTLPTPQVPATLPYSDDFANTATDWTLLNGTQTNTWFIGGATGNAGNSLYVSDDGGTTNAYTVSPASVASVVQAYRDIALTSGVNPFKLLFDWKCIGEGTSTNYDYFRVWVVPHTYVPAPGSQISATGSGGIQLGGNINDADASTASWHTENFIIPDSFAGDTVRLVFEWRNDGSSGSQPPAAIDNIHVTEITCAAPTALTISNVANTSADISWTTPAMAPANGYLYYYSTNSAVPTNTTSPSGSISAPLTTTGLAPLTANTKYYVWVRSVCSATDTSDWTGGMSFTTLCDADAIPYVAPLASVTTPDVPSCMSTELINTLGTEWYTSNNPGSGFTGNTLVNTYTGSGDGAVNNWVYTNGLLLSGGLAYQLHYRYGNNSTTYVEKLEVKYGTYPAVASMATLLTDHTNIDDATSHDTTVTFTPATTGTYYIGFHAYSDENQYNLYLDSITVMLVPCDSAIALTTSNITPTSADLSWTGTAGQYTLEYGAAGFALGAGSTVSVTGNTYTLNNLNPNNTYDYYVRAICTPGLDSSAYSVSGTFTTLCDAISVDLGNDTVICTGNSVILDAGNPAATFVWSDASVAQTLSVNATGDYYVTATNIYGCAASDTVSITVDPLPVVDLGSDTGICEGDTLSLDAGNTGSVYLWNDASVLQSLDVFAAGDYSVTVTNTNNCSSSDTITITINVLPVADLGADTAICAGNTVTLDAGNAGSAYLWNDASTLQTLDADTSGDYYVVVTNVNGCTASDTLTLMVNDLPVVDLGADTSICEGDTLLLDAGNAGSDYLWNDASLAQTLAVFAAGDYWVVVTNTDGCYASDTINLEIRPAPSVDGIIVTDNGGGSYSFEAENPADVIGYEWDFGDGSPHFNSNSPTHTYANTGTDSITVTLIVSNACGIDSASVKIPGPGVGIGQIEPGKDRLKLYPNPARNLITIQNESHYKMEEVTVYNVLGQTVFQAYLKNVSKYRLDVSGYTSGLYQVRIKMNGGFVMRKFEVMK